MLAAGHGLSQTSVEKIALQKVAAWKLVEQLVVAKLSVLKLVVAQLVVAKLVVAKVVVATLVGKLVVLVAEPNLVVGGKKVGKLAVAYLVFLWPSAGEASCKLEVEAPT